MIFTAEADPMQLRDDHLLVRLHAPADLERALELFHERAEVKRLILVADEVDGFWQQFSDRFVPLLAAGGAVSDDRGRLLVIHRLGVWDLPKGKVDAGESVEAAAVREVREECGLSEVHLEEFLCDTWHTYVRRGLHHLKRTCWYRMQAPGDQVLIPQTDEDITEVRWADKDLLREVRANTYGSLLPVFSAWEAEGPRSRT